MTEGEIAAGETPAPAEEPWELAGELATGMLRGEEERERRTERDAIEAAREGRPPPQGPIEYDTEEAAFWEQRYIPPGSVIAFQSSLDDGVPDGEVAVLVQKVEHDREGVQLWVALVGTELIASRTKVQRYFKKERKVHICFLVGGVCTANSQGDIHLRHFTWHAPGEYAAPWLTNQGKKLVREGLVLASRADATEEKPAMGGANPTRVEERLGALRRKRAPVVSFAPGTAPPRDGPKLGGPSDTSGGGLLALGTGPTAAATPKRKVKKEPIVVPSDDEGPPRPRRGKSLGLALAKAVDARQKMAEGRRQSPRSRSRGRRKRRSRRRKDSRSASPRSEREDSSSSDSLVPPLKKKSRRDPGSVFKMLEAQATEHLAQESLLEEDETSLRNRPRMYSYYQLGLRPYLDAKSRDNREISFLARGLDLLKEGKLPELADHMAARLIAVNTASSQGWSVAQSLEIHKGEEDGPAPAHILLQAHRHTRQIEKAGGKGSWSRHHNWSGEWSQDGGWKGSGKGGKGKTKKGKGKQKGGKPWSGGEKEKGMDNAPKGGEK